MRAFHGQRAALCLALAAALAAGGCGKEKEKTAEQPGRLNPLRYLRRSEEPQGPRVSKPELPSREATKLSPEARKNYDAALELVRQRDYRRALTLIGELLEKSPRDADVYALKGDCHHQLLEFEEAVRCYRAALQLRPDHYMARRGMGYSEYNLANRLAGEGNYQTAFDHYRAGLEALRQATQVMPADAEAAWARGLCADALAAYIAKRSLALRDENNDLSGAETMFDLALQLSDEAAAAARFYAQRHPDKVEPRALTGLALARKAKLYHEFKRPQQADAELERSAQVWQSILENIDRNHTGAKEELQNCLALRERWRAQQQELPFPQKPLPAP